jgi:magnesium-transporting ATPase (P-type)
MKRRGFQISRRHRLTLYAVSLTLFLSGVCWAWIHHLDEAGRAGEDLVKLKQPLIAVHGFSAMAFVLLLGTLLAGHVRRAWHARKNWKNGVFFLAAISLLTLSGYALYYLGDENWRNAAGHFHLWLGVMAPAFLVLHIWLGRCSTSN